MISTHPPTKVQSLQDEQAPSLAPDIDIAAARFCLPSGWRMIVTLPLFASPFHSTNVTLFYRRHTGRCSWRKPPPPPCSGGRHGYIDPNHQLLVQSLAATLSISSPTSSPKERYHVRMRGAVLCVVNALLTTGPRLGSEATTGLRSVNDFCGTGKLLSPKSMLTVLQAMALSPSILLVITKDPHHMTRSDLRQRILAWLNGREAPSREASCGSRCSTC